MTLSLAQAAGSFPAELSGSMWYLLVTLALTRGSEGWLNG